MPSPFPGMDPYLESPDLWPDVHHGIISQMQVMLNPVLRPRYVARVELRVYISDDDDPGREVIIPDVRIQRTKRKGEKKPKKRRSNAVVAVAEPLTVPLLLDDEIEEARLEIRQQPTGSLVTVIEVLSPTNKIRGARGRASFMEKRREILVSDVHWLEIDLLRAGEPTVTHPPLVPSDYRILLSRAGERNQTRYWPVKLRERLPNIDIPLRGAEHVPLALADVLAVVYDHGAYDLSIDYHKAPKPPLTPADAAWADHLLRRAGYR